MSRRTHYWYYIINEEGQPIEDVNVSVLEAESSTFLWIYNVEEGGTAFCDYEKTASAVGDGTPQLRTDENGYVEFWVADSSDSTYGYSDIKIKLLWTKPGTITDGVIDNIEFTSSTRMYSASINTGSWAATGGQYYSIIYHQLGNQYPIVMLYDESTTLSEAITAASIDTNTLKIYKNNNTTATVTIIG